MVQTIVRSNRFPDPVILAWEHRGVRSIGSDHSSIWVWTKTWDTYLEFSYETSNKSAEQAFLDMNVQVTLARTKHFM